MISLQLDILNERALDVIRYLEKVQDIRIVQDKEIEPHIVKVKETEPEEHTQLAESSRWGGAIKNPSEKLLAYADKVREEWHDRI